VFFFQLGIAILIGWTVISSIWRGWRGFGDALVLSAAVLASVAGAFDADLVIAERTVERLQRHAPSDARFKVAHLDVSYLARLGDDALPVLEHAYFRDRSEVREHLRDVWRERAERRLEGGWRAWRGWQARW
jgi:hypothetical protein